MDGILVVWKPKGITSFGVVAKVRKLANTKRVGHGGTLDPLAEGVLVLALGKATRILEYMQGVGKTYEAEATLGATSDTYDSEGTLVPGNDRIPSRAEVENALASFVGASEQVPPAYSAIHVNGQRAYALARKGESVELPPRPIEIRSITLLEYQYPVVKFEAAVSGGTYIRSLVHDLGTKLGTGAYMHGLVRTVAGNCVQEQAHTLEELERDGIAAYVMPILPRLLQLVVLPISEAQCTDLRHGKRLLDTHHYSDGPVQLVLGNTVVGIADIKEGVIHPHKIF